jgi:cyclopropane-fatty-acyl-phospholipid synthase
MESSLTRPIARSSENIWQSIILEMLQKMNKGYIELTLPGGLTLEWGDRVAPVHAVVNINDNDFFQRCGLYGDIGFGEAYVDGLWETPDITKVIAWFLLNIDTAPTLSGSKVAAWTVNLLRIVNRLTNRNRINTRQGSRKNISDHYDLNNEFFSLFLDPSMTYSAAYFKSPDLSLEEAQYEKYKALCERINLTKEDHVLEIGTGWGGNAVYMAKNYGCRVTTATISAEQFRLACERVAREGLSDRITVLLKDYRELEGIYDKIVSIEMLEAVGHKFLQTYFSKCHSLLKKDGLLGIQVITSPDSRYENLRKGVDWIQKHIFPGSLLPSVAAINHAVNKTGDMTLVELQDLGVDYGKTLRCWHSTFNENWNRIKALGFEHRFKRKWNYYLSY